jgi:hypothetical protein
VARKYKIGREQAIANRERQRALAAQVGFDMMTTDESRFYNTFDARRVLHWARIEGRQEELKRALLVAYHTHMQNPGDRSCSPPRLNLLALKARLTAMCSPQGATPTRCATLRRNGGEQG